MIKHTNPIRSIRRDETGAALIEFAFLAPAFLLMFFGAFDVGYSIYFRAVLDGAIQESARESAMEGGSAKLTALDTSLTKKLRNLNANAQVSFNRKSYFSFNEVKRAEKFTDGNSNGVCDNNEQFEDENNNAGWDLDVGASGVGGPKDVVLYTVTVTYTRIFPLWAFVGQPQNNTFSATTVLKNQPYGDQANKAIQVKNCV
jgi:Flp pilus assembly protein TadG